MISGEEPGGSARSWARLALGLRFGERPNAGSDDPSWLGFDEVSRLLNNQ
jgi:hypothetical protein